MTEGKMSNIMAKLDLKEFKLNSLLEITRAINENYSIDKLLKIYEFILREQLDITRILLYSFDQDEWKTLLSVGVKGALKQKDIENYLKNVKDITLIESSSVETINIFDVVIPVYHKNIPLAFLLLGDLDENAMNISPAIKHMPFIQTLTNIIVVAIENKRFANEMVKQERAKKELELAKEMQEMLFPKNLPSNNRIDVAAKYVAKQMVGGDYYDFIQLNDNEYVLCIADVSGKGISAALLMSNFQAHLRANTYYNHQELTLQELVEQLNATVNDAVNGEKFITFFIAYYHCGKKILKYINAGHNYPVLTDGTNARFLNKGCVGLGMFEKIPHMEMEEITIHPGDTLVCYTDGLVELENENNEAFETDRLIELIHTNYDLPMVELNKLIFSQLKEFKGKMEYPDDTALLSCRFF
jgi:phosphoserine phosphatase RsbU/P